VSTLFVSLAERSYPIHIGKGLLGNRELVASLIEERAVLIVTNDVVGALYLDRLRESLPGDPKVVMLPDGEAYKTLESFERVIDALIDGEFHRDACIVALGGGVVGDIAGFAAACYQRGIAYVQVPTTLLAQVDSSVGGKTAVNHPRAKNMIGAFHQPVGVLADTDVLATLPPRELAAGLAEVIKYGLILDAAFFAWLERHIDALLALDPKALEHAIRRSCELKAEIVAEDEREQGRRALLNLGHTFAHALESLGRYEHWLHGEAVALGICLAGQVSQAYCGLGAAEYRRIEALLGRAGLPVRAPGLDAERVVTLMRMDKKAAAAGLRLVLLNDIGRAVVTASPGEPELARLLRRAFAA
jgi:3-dehydroquinate synthase